MTHLRVAIDGPAGAGKSTVAKKVAEKLGLIYIDTGAMYRAVTWKAIKSGIPPTDEKKITQLASSIHISFQSSDNQQKVYADGVDVTEQIRSAEVTGNVSKISAIPGVRARLVELQREMAQTRGVVMDGRDIGTFVLPDAEVKIFLTASLEERARRRTEELSNKGIQADPVEILKSIARRDEMDSTRDLAPLKKADDARIIDTTGLSIPEVVDRIVTICHDYIGTNRRGEEYNGV
ncbi:(d)CMP kinase [Effusibacillus lacus]|uniref:Cytidylate kinase n=1 Tax=Effusibacillus lacus TaxID=1348429 RepID=A0A292YLB1_9BACL|nr:(d)CMP kinase [Effusibacillus lacus]TCS75262.1 cytidylate kinase [Effusibacillus lacus]GAX89701.1 cytidylate kinase [Effusibacillus lacus]